MKAIALFLALSLAGCASDIPRPIREAPADDIAFAQALKNPEQHRGAAVRWGGAIAAVENRRDETWIEIASSKSRASSPSIVTMGRLRRSSRRAASAASIVSAMRSAAPCTSGGNSSGRWYLRMITLTSSPKSPVCPSTSMMRPRGGSPVADGKRVNSTFTSAPSKSFRCPRYPRGTSSPGGMTIGWRSRVS